GVGRGGGGNGRGRPATECGRCALPLPARRAARARGHRPCTRAGGSDSAGFAAWSRVRVHGRDAALGPGAATRPSHARPADSGRRGAGSGGLRGRVRIPALSAGCEGKMDKLNRFHSRGTYRMLRLDYFMLTAALACVVLAHWREVHWTRFGLAFAWIDAVGTLPAYYVYYLRRRGTHRSIPRLFYLLYNGAHSYTSNLIVIVAWY